MTHQHPFESPTSGVLASHPSIEQARPSSMKRMRESAFRISKAFQINSPFPWKLFQLLEDAEKEGNEDIVSWLPEGNAFVIYKPEEFCKSILPKYFRQTVFKSFTRQLYLYGFSKVSIGYLRDGCWCHPHFLKDGEDLQLVISTKKKKVGDSRTATDFTRSDDGLIETLFAGAEENASPCNISSEEESDNLVESKRKRIDRLLSGHFQSSETNSLGSKGTNCCIIKSSSPPFPAGNTWEEEPNWLSLLEELSTRDAAKDSSNQIHQMSSHACGSKEKSDLLVFPPDLLAPLPIEDIFG